MPVRRWTLAVATSFSMIGAAHADPVTWNLAAAFGGDDTDLSATGSFVYDADTGAYSDVSLETPEGSIMAGTYKGALGPLASASVLDFISSTGQSRFRIVWDAPMTDAGGLLTPIRASEWICENATCAFPGFGPGLARGLASGTFISAVPTPGTLSLLLAGLAGVAAIGRRRKPVRR